MFKVPPESEEDMFYFPVFVYMPLFLTKVQNNIVTIGVGYTGAKMPFSQDKDEHRFSAFYTMYLGRKKPFFLIWTQ